VIGNEDDVSRIGFISDIHANLEALEAVLADAGESRVDAMVCLGDVVGYGPDPVECLELVAGTCEIMVRGNHDEAVRCNRLSSTIRCGARDAIEFTRGALNDDHFGLIDLMQHVSEIGDLSLAHATFGPLRYEYLYSADVALRAFGAMRTPIGVVGHTHMPSVFCMGRADDAGLRDIEARPLVSFAELKLERGTRLILNPGSVGQPRDRNPDASWGLLDSERMTFQIRRVAYDIDAVQAKLARLGLPDHLGERLRVGA